ncbi:Mot1 [Coprinopsis cinerea okayama7|uniref:TATA-binding protein-associated factor mot1 n=1 Tax=Coprinopsis cinerea (strain Okayama-7 / 130 / ATCC MYA-4618 / FGSC 9003) TaxID=240176 RepID=D6RKN4_COPC7|nr:Mot1 [Coprinopsis cinerea okayama7\|eukprot:XP_002911886.1 Mot1 [Coprinopsis cinerea okayama7\
MPFQRHPTNTTILQAAKDEVEMENTAAKQLAQLAVKSVTSDVAVIEEDTKSKRQQATLRDRTSWAELMAVVARIIPYLHSKSYESRTAASVALSQIFSLSPVWQPLDGHFPTSPVDAPCESPPEYPKFLLAELLDQGKLLLASSGKEFIKPAGILASAAEVKKARKEAMSRLGLEFLDDVADDMDLDKELTEQMVIEDEAPPPQSTETRQSSADVEMALETPPLPKEPVKEPSAPCDTAAPSPTSSATPSIPEPDLSTLSARERNRLKRKRKPGNSAFVAAPPPPPQSSGSKYAPAMGASSSKARLIAAEESTSTKSRVNSPIPGDSSSTSERVVIDPSKGGAVNAKLAKQSKALEVEDGCWIWDGVVKLLEVDLFSAAWEVRHGAALALRELLKVQGRFDSLSYEENELAHEKWCNDLSAQFLCVLVLDRFGDFVSDQVIAPVRETVSQTLASLLIHMPRRSLVHVHSILVQMTRQDSITPPQNGATSDPERTHVWEVRHAGLLGIKYEVAVRSDLFDVVPKQEDGQNAGGRAVLKDVVDSAILGLGDKDDDVRAVAASCLLPVARHLVEQLPESLERVLVVLWHCLSDMKDDLSSSVGAVMDLLGTLVTYERVIQILGNDSVALPLSTLAVTLFPFFRHTISNVRLAVVKTLDSFMAVPSLPRGWVAAHFLCLLFQNLICEEREDIRVATSQAWKRALLILSQTPGTLESMLDQQLVLDWYAIMMTPIGVPIDSSKFYRPSITANGENLPERHNVDKNMLAQDLSLIPMETIMKSRVAAATALAELLLRWPSEAITPFFRVILIHYVDSISMLQKFLSGIIAEEWAEQYARENPSGPLLTEKNDMAKEISDKTLLWLQAKPPLGYHEMTPALTRIHMECAALLQAFHSDCKLPMSSIPNLGQEVDITGTAPGAFTIDTARVALGSHYTRLRDSLGRTKKKELAVLAERREKIEASITRYMELKAQNDNRVSASFAAAFVSLRTVPDKVSPIVKGIMNGVKNEENEDLQTRSALSVARFIDFCIKHNIVQPPDKIVKNLCTFLCQDSEQTPMFSYCKQDLEGILSFRTVTNGTQANGKESFGASHAKFEETRKAQLSRRGGKLAFAEFSRMFGSRLLDVLPNVWPCMVGGLLSAFNETDSPEKSDQLIEKQFGQDVIDSLSVLEAVLPTFHPDLLPKFNQIFPMLELGIRSRFAIIRQCATRCFATLCDVMTNDAMRYVVEKIIPLIGDPLNLSNRQGAVELIYQIVQRLDIKVLPYVIFLVVPVLGRMSDANDEIRSTATNTFASLVKMVPLEAGLPDPIGFSDELLKRRDEERQFLAQLLDGSKVDQYQIPVKVNAELRKYQQDGVNWLAFLAKYQLHGILCDDMGLGKTLQSICILASKHQERRDKYRETKSPDAVHLPSLIICPPTLTGHWYYEILKYVENLKPILYTGNARERSRMLPKLQQHDVVITSYEVVRNDIANLESLKWLYCILDEGHVIKNAKTKLTKAVKSIQAQHRLILSGTPIQNNVLELWSLFDFLMPGFLGTESSFNERFGKPILSNRDGKNKNAEAAALALEALHKQVLPFLLRRLKEDVLNDLPPKIIQDYYCELSELQKNLYDDFSKSKAGTATGKTLKSDVVEKGDPAQQHVFQSLQYLRKLCNHPALVLRDEEATKVALENAKLTKDSLRDIQNAPKLLALKQLLMDCGIGSPPALAADSQKSELIDAPTDTSGTFSQHRVLIFCQMKQMLDIIETDLFKPHMPSVTYMRLDGSTDANKRHAIVQTFNSDPSIDCLLLTTHVGGLGLTLTGADTVIFVEHDWNPMKDLQAMDRAHRIGQKKVVNVYRLITKGTLEEKIMGLQRFKLNIANSIVNQQNSGLSSMDTDQVLDLFRRTTEEEDSAAAAKKAKEANKPMTQKSLLAALEDMPEEEYEGLDLSSFMSSLGR